MDNSFYTYAYLREDGTPYYIGKGKGKRAFKRSGRFSCNRPKDRKFILILKKGLTEDEAFRHEIYMIAVLGRKDLGTGIIRNLTNGGDGASGYKHSPEAIERIRKSKEGLPRSEETKKRIGEGHRGKSLSEETKKKLSAIHKGKKRTGVPRDEQGRCVCSVNAIRSMLAAKDENGKSINAVKGGRNAAKKVHSKKDELGRSVHAVNGGRKASAQRWKCLVTGKVSGAGPLTNYQKARGIDITLRERVI
jgi:hypothetical protein